MKEAQAAQVETAAGRLQAAGRGGSGDGAVGKEGPGRVGRTAAGGGGWKYGW